MISKIIILTPILNDWYNLKQLLVKINKIFEKKIKKNFDLIIVNDCSNDLYDLKRYKLKMIKKIYLINLKKNVGSQRAIAIGIKYIDSIYKKKFRTIIIDSDGQDNPQIIQKMLSISKTRPESSIAVNRGQRKEELWFRVFYELYCFTIKIFYFRKIRFGNFSLINSNHLKIISRQKELWSAFPPTLSKSVSNLIHITANRERRYSGDSKMNFFGLIRHALRVFSVLKNKVIFSSTIYLILSFLIIYKHSEFYFFIIFSLLVFFNLIIFIFSMGNKKNLSKNLSKAKIKSF